MFPIGIKIVYQYHLYYLDINNKVVTYEGSMKFYANLIRLGLSQVIIESENGVINYSDNIHSHLFLRN